MNVCVTGTRFGMTPAQRVRLYSFVDTYRDKITSFHHGLCRGVDVEARDIVSQALPKVPIHAHPGPDGDEWQGDALVKEVLHEGKGHFARNREMVELAEVVVVIPKEVERQEKGGTWYTHDYALKRGKRVVLITPEGVLQTF